MSDMSLLALTGGVVVTMDPLRRVLESGTVLIDGHDIAAVGPAHDVEVPAEAEVIDAAGHVILPGLINAHTHVPQILLRGGASHDRDLWDWLFNVLYPGLQMYGVDDVKVAATLYCAEAIRSGITTFVDNEDMGTAPDGDAATAAIEAYIDAGVRAIYAKMFMDQAPPEMDEFLASVRAKEPAVVHQSMLEPLDTVLDQLEALMRSHHGAAGGRISVWPSPANPVNVSPAALHQSQALAQRFDSSWTLHLAETTIEHQMLGLSPTEWLHNHGALDNRLLAGHCVHVSSRDIRLLGRAGVRVSTQPVSNSYLGSGIAPVPEMLAAGIVVGVGTDDGCCNDSVNLINDIKVLACVHRAASCDASVITAEEALEMITIRGAEALGMADRIGSLEPGKAADVIVVDLRQPHTTPAPDPAAALVWQANGSEVRTVVIDGAVVMRDRQLAFLTPSEEAELLQEASRRAAAILARAGIVATRLWRTRGG